MLPSQPWPDHCPAELFVHPGDQHLFPDSSLDAYDPELFALLMERVRVFLASV